MSGDWRRTSPGTSPAARVGGILAKAAGTLRLPAFPHTERAVCVLRASVLALVVFSMLAASPRSPAAEEPAPAAAAAEELLRFRRVYVPLDRLKDWPRDEARYVPMDKVEFESLLQRARLQVIGWPAGVPQAVTHARYTARLLADSLVDGEAVLDIAPPAGTPSTVWLAPCGLAISEATWLGDPPQPAALAVGEDGKLGVRAAQPGQLRLKWSLGGQRRMTGGIDFAAELPACPSARLTLAVPKQLAPLVERAVVTRAGTAGDGWDRWQIELGGQYRFRLQLLPTEDLIARRKRNTLRQSLAYEFSLGGVELSAQWTLDVPSAALRQLVVDLDPTLQLVTARYGGLPVAWSVVGPADPRASTRVVLELPEPIRGTGRVVRLGAVAPSVLGTRWRLPAMRPQGVFWQEGTATLIAPAPLTWEQLTVEGGRQTQGGPLPGPQSGEIAEFQCFSPNAAIDVVLAKTESPLEFDCGTALELSGVDMAAEATARFRVADGERFQIDADVSRLWAVDSVETEPANALEDWTLLKGDGATGRLSIRLAKALCPARPVKVTVQARHHYSPLGRLLARDELVPIEFRGARGGRRLVSIRAAEAYQLRLSGAEGLTRVDPQNLAPADLELFDDPPKGIVFVNDAQAAAMHVALEPQRPSYSASVHVEATATDAGLSESYAIRCAPESGRVDRLLVQFSQSRNAPLRWSFSPEGQDQVTVRHWKPGEHAAGSPPARGESFEIVFRRPRIVPFEIRAVRTLPFPSPVSISLAGLPEAARQEGTVSVGSTSSRAVRIETRHVTPIPLAPTPGDQYSTVRSVYRYAPAQDVGPASEAAVILTPQLQSAPPWAWAWSCQVESRYEAGGTAHHLVTYRMQNGGRSRILLALPEDLGLDAIRGIWVDGVRTARESAAEGGGDWLAVPLPAGRKFPTVSVLLARSGRPLHVVDFLEPMVPQLDVPVLQHQWTAWLPQGYRSGVPGVSGQTPWGAAKTIAQRWFGVLARPQYAPRFSPWSADDWARLAGAADEAAQARQNAELLLERLGSVEPPSSQEAAGGGPSEASANISWGDRLARVAAGLEFPVLVDRASLARAGLRCRDAVPKVRGETALEHGISIAEQAGLSLLVSNEAVLLTSASDAALCRAYLAPAGTRLVWRVLPSPLAERLATAAESGHDSSLIPLENWSRLSDVCEDPWTRLSSADPGSAETSGWSAYRMELSDEQAAVLPIVHSDILRGLGWSVFVAVFALLAWRGRGHPVLLAGLVGLSAPAALLVPDAFTPLCSAVLWATLAVVALEWPIRRDSVPAGRADSSVATQRRAGLATAVRAGIVLLAAASAFACSGAAGGEPAGAAPPDAAYQVLIPVDQKQQPSGDKYYVPEGFFSRLQAAASGRSEDRRGWLLQSAVYRGTMSWRSAPEQLGLEEIRASFDIEVFGRQIRVRLPIGRAGVEVPPDGVTLEGRTIQPTWPDAEGNMSFEVAEPGKYRLELTMRPIGRTVGEKTVVQCTIPRLATSRLELMIPHDAPNLELPSVMGAVVREPDPARLLAALGPTDRLEVAWPEGAAPSGQGLSAEAEQLLWLKIRPDSVVLDTMLSIRVLEGRMREVQLAVDPRLRYFPAKTDGASADRPPLDRSLRDGGLHVSERPDHVSGAGEPQMVRFRLPEPASGKFVTAATFLLHESSGLGNYRLPLVDVLNARTTKRWLAVSVDASLEHSQAGTDQLRPIAVPAFVAAWGGAKSPPLSAWDLPSPQPDWSVSTRLASVRTAAEQTLTLSFAPRCAHVLLDASVSSFGEPVFQHRIAAPPELEIEQVSVRENGAERVSRWARGANGRTIVFLKGPATGRQQLTLRGSLPAPEQGRLSLPLIRLEAEPTRPMGVALFREPAVQVQVQNLKGLVADDTASADDKPGAPARLVRALRAEEPKSAAADVRIAPNRPRIRAEQLTWIRGSAGAWQLEVEFRLRISDGVADQFRFNAPPQWIGPYNVAPQATVALLDVPGKPYRQLTVRPRLAAEGDYRLSISGLLKPAVNERPSVPHIGAEEIDIARHLVVLPTGPQIASMSWETRGLVPAQLPRDIPVPPGDRASLAVYRVVSDSFQATAHAGAPGQAKPQVHLADLRFACQADGSFHSLASYDLEPAGLAACPVSLPPGCRLVQVFVGGQPALAAPDGEDHWLVPLQSRWLVQRLEVLFVGQGVAPGTAASLEFAVPALGEIPVRQSIWAVSAPGGYRLRASEPSASFTPLEHALAGLRNLTAIAQGVAELPDVEGEPLTRWYGDFSGRWLAVRGSVARALAWSEAAPEVESVRAEVESLEKRQAAAADRLGLASLASQAAGSNPPTELATTWLSLQESRRVPFQYGTAAAAGPIRVVCQEESTSGAAPRVLAALAVAVLACAAASHARRGTFSTLLVRWPYVAGFIAGAAWWWWLRPSVLGLCLALACAAAGAWSFWRQRSARRLA